MKRLALALLAAVISVQCSPVTAPETEPQYRGTITAMPAEQNGFRYLVEARPGEWVDDKIYVRASSSTLFLRRVGDHVKPASAADMVVGTSVELWVDGPVADSYPQQGRAAVLLIPDIVADQ